jgi:predicted ArsR family transcriptional regulator
MNHPTREVILRTLRAQGKCTVRELADAAEISPVSVRHHLSNLQAEGLVEIEEIRHGVGRPRQVFSLTDRAMELFPSRYFRLTHRLLGEMKDTLPPTTVDAIFSGVAATMAKEYAETLAGLPLEKRLERLIESLTFEGFDAELGRSDDQIIIRELSCPYFRIGREHPEICMVDQSFIATALSLPVEKVTCLLNGHPHCTFAIPRESVLTEATPNG